MDMKVLCFLLLLLPSSFSADDSPVVRISHGDIRGSILTTRLGKPIFTFRGIPFAKPPVGNLRFHMMRDGLICYGEDAATKVISKSSKAPVFYYRFAYQGRYSWRNYPGTTTPYGVVHLDDLIYLFNISTVFPSFKSEDPEIKTVDRMTTLWVNFAQTGNTTPRKTELLQNLIWEPLTTDNLKYLDIGPNLQMQSGLHQDTLPVWNTLFYPDYS